MHSNRDSSKLILFATVGVILGFVYIFGIATARYELFPYKQLQSLKQVFSEPEVDWIDYEIETVFNDLICSWIPIPVEREGQGGEMTVYKNRPLLMTHEGKFFSISEAEGATLLNIEAPENNLKGYMEAAATDKYKHLQHGFYHFRYNDILYIDTPAFTRVVISYTEWNSENETYGNTLAKLSFPADLAEITTMEATADDWEVFYRSTPGLTLMATDDYALNGKIAGGALALSADGKLILANGCYYDEGYDAPLTYSQFDDNDYGKILEIDLNTHDFRVLTKGHRDIQGMSYDTEGRLWALEHGPLGGDELNLIVEGNNYGWGESVLGTHYDRRLWKAKDQVGRHLLHPAPIYAWLPSVGISDLMHIYNFDPAWDGDMIATSLMGRTLYRLRIREGRVMFAEDIYFGKRLRGISSPEPGLIAIWTDEHRFYFMRVKNHLSYE